jgi:hypothetical protein
MVFPDADFNANGFVDMRIGSNGLVVDEPEDQSLDVRALVCRWLGVFAAPRSLRVW